MKRIITVGVALVLCLCFAASPAVLAAQSKVDVGKVAKTVKGKDPEGVLKALQTPIAKGDLPQGFTDVQIAGGNSATAGAMTSGGCMSSGDIFAQSIPGAKGTVGYCVTGDEKTLGGHSSTSITYVGLAKDSNASSLLDQMEKGVGSLGQQGMSIKKVKLGGVDVLHMGAGAGSSGMQMALNMYIVPVGNFLVMTTMTVTGSADVSADTVGKAAEDLTLAAVAHLGDVAGSAK